MLEKWHNSVRSLQTAGNNSLYRNGNWARSFYVGCDRTELFALTLNRIPASNQYVSFTAVVLRLGLNYQPQYVQTNKMVRNEESGAVSKLKHRHDNSVAGV